MSSAGKHLPGSVDILVAARNHCDLHDVGTLYSQGGSTSCHS